ncbi:MAG: ammonia-forming cytochrome c nitrite reductase subunit c552 [Bacteroidota bacterium]|nr:ammonia-forming cytochrome c nitrite reductase subunit c552 [Bacteroidota bacterium]
MTARHANTQKDVAGELSTNWAGQTPDSVISGSQAEDCVGCHAPTAVAVNGGRTETQVMSTFFTTVSGKYTAATDTVHSAQWPSVSCTTCHNVPSDHPTTMPTQMIFNSQTAKYDSVQNVSALCGNCHGNLHFADTDHQLYNAWSYSKHGRGGQADVAGELSTNDVGATPADVTADEDCIGCHAPTSVQLNGGISEAQALGTFFSTDGNGKFSASTAPVDTMQWTNVACNTCHDPHNPDTLSYFNSATKSYHVMSSSDELCGQCHGNLRFSGTDHLSYNIGQGTGGVNVPDQVTMPGAKCIDCHMFKNDVDGSNAKNYAGHSWQVFVEESDGTRLASCTNCHTAMTADSACSVIASWQAGFAELDSTAEALYSIVDTVLADSNVTHRDSVNAAEALANMTYAESDESGGFHNYKYSVALLTDAIAKARTIVTGVQAPAKPVPVQFALMQNYPNPFNPTTHFQFSIAKSGFVSLKVYDILGREIATLVNEQKSPGTYEITFDASRLTSGIYFYQLSSSGFVAVKKLMLLK